MLKNIFAVAYMVLGIYWAFVLHTRLFASYGAKRLARFVAYVGGALLVWTGVGLMDARLFGGWHALKGSGFERHTSVSEGLTMALVLGTITGLVGFVLSEKNGGQMLLELVDADAMWGDYTRRILAIESRASATDKRRTSKFLVRNSGSTEQLSAELNAYVTRNSPAASR